MRTGIYFRPCKNNGLLSAYVRIQSTSEKTDFRVATGVFLKADDVNEWKILSGNKLMDIDFPCRELEILNSIKYRVELSLNLGTFSSTRLKEIILECRFPDEFATEKMKQQELISQSKSEASHSSTDFQEYMKLYLHQVSSGERFTPKGKPYARGTVAALKQTIQKINNFCETRGSFYSFDEIDINFYRDFVNYLKSIGYNLNSIGKSIRILKSVLHNALDDGYPVNRAFMSKAFIETRATTESIYLTRANLDAMMAVDLSAKGIMYEIARDVFMIGVWTAQRVSDYNNLCRENIMEGDDGTTIQLTQRKTGKRVVIPCCSRLCTILQRYPDSLPHLSERLLNRYIKEIGFWADITEEVSFNSTKGGMTIRHSVPKYKLIQSHTARRTGATLMYLSGMDVYDICKITGHSDVRTLEKYIKADSLETIRKFKKCYRYFD